VVAQQLHAKQPELHRHQYHPSDEQPRASQSLLDINKDGKADWIRGSSDGIHFDLGNGSGGFTENAAVLPISGLGADGRRPGPVRRQSTATATRDLVTEWGQYENVGSFSRIYRNDGNLHFTDITAAAGLPTTEGFAVKGVGRRRSGRPTPT